MKLFEAIKKAKALLSTVKLTQEPLSDGSLIQYDGDTISANEVIYLMSGSENWSILPDGSYVTKSQTNFTIAEGVVSAVILANTPIVENKPVLQAQSAQEEILGTDIPATEAPAKAEEIVEEVKLADATVTVDVNTVISAALSPIYESISQIQDQISKLAELYVTQEAFTKTEGILSNTQQAMSKISDVVAVLAKEPAGTPIEKEVNPFNAVPQEFKETQTYKIFNS